MSTTPTDYPQAGNIPIRFSDQVGADLSLQLLRERKLLDLMAGPFPERANDFRDFTRVLDIDCGAGCWALEVARTNLHLEVVGITRQQELVAWAREQAEADGLNNVTFLLMADDEKLRLPFPAATFDLVNTQNLHSWLQADAWRDFVRDCWRVTRQGGYLRMTEPERGQATSPALERLLDLYLQALHKTGQRVSPDDRHIGAANQLPHLCQEAGWSEITRRAYIIDYQKKSDLPEDYARRRLRLYAQTVQPLILREGLASTEEIVSLLQQASTEVENEDFVATRFLITVSAHKLAG